MNKKLKHVLFVTADDWKGMYVDGILEYENHDISSGDMLNVLGTAEKDGFVFGGDIECDEDWLMSLGHLPKKLSDVKRAN